MQALRFEPSKTVLRGRRGAPAWLAVVILCGALATAGIARAQTEAPRPQGRALHLVTAVGPPFTRTRDGAPGFLDVLFGKAFARLGIDIEVARLPGERALMNANSGVDDGDLFRVAGLEARYPGLVRVPESYFQAEFVVIARKDAPRIDGWAALAGHSVGFINGLKIAEQKLSGVAPMTQVDTLGQLFHLLERGRVEFIITERQVGLRNLRRRRLEDAFRVQDHVLVRPQIYAYLNVRHAALVVPLAEALREMKASGAYDALAKAAFREPRPAD